MIKTIQSKDGYLFPCHGDGTKDDRYTVYPEFMGYTNQLLAVRFDGKLIGAATDQSKANHIMSVHAVERSKQ